ncbi:MAG: hypothetical protein ACI9P7_002408, partial [Candidatus Azotimanducaceae bacterium]
ELSKVNRLSSSTSAKKSSPNTTVAVTLGCVGVGYQKTWALVQKFEGETV